MKCRSLRPSAREVCSKRRFPEGSLGYIVERKQGHQLESRGHEQTGGQMKMGRQIQSIWKEHQ